MTDSKTSQLPLNRDITSAQILSLVVAGLMGGISLVSLAIPDKIYPSEELVQTFLPNDVVNLFIGLPVLLASLFLLRRGVLTGLLLLPGALLYVLYNYIAYVFGIPFSFLSIGYLALVLLSAYTIFALLNSMDKIFVQEQLSGRVPVRLSGWVLVVFGAAFSIRAIAMLAEGFTSGDALPGSEVGVLVADLVISMLWIAGGAMLLRRMPLGYVSGLGLLFAGSMLFIALIVFLLLQPALTGAPFSLVDVVVVFIMGLVCSIPFGLYLRGVQAI